jgi:hypothetical protein
MAKCTQYNISDKVCQSLATGLWISPGTPVSTTNKTDHHDIAEKLLKNPNPLSSQNICSLIKLLFIYPLFQYRKSLQIFI